MLSRVFNWKGISFVAAFLLAMVLFSRAFAAGEIDATFGATLTKTTAERANLTLIQPDGKILMDGLFEAANGITKNGFVRLNTDGTLDTTFNPPEILPHFGGAGMGIKAIDLQSNGKIIIAGYFNSIGGLNVPALARLNADGSYDNSFVVDPAIASQVTFLADMKIFPDDRIVFGIVNSGGGVSLRKLLPNGGLDPSFNSTTTAGAWKLAIQSDGKVVFSGLGHISRFNANGTADGSFITSTFSQQIWDVAVQTDGKILVGGQFASVNGFLLPKIARFNTDGTVDVSFNAGFPGTSGGYISKVTVAPDGTIYAGGVSLTHPSQTNTNLYRVVAGGIDPTFSQSNFGILDIDVQTDGKVIFSTLYNSSVPNRIFGRLNVNGSNDSGFAPNFGNRANGRKIFVQSDGKILVGGDYRFANSFLRNNLTRFNANGSVDTGFNTAFAFVEQNYISAIDVQPDGKIIIGDAHIIFDVRRLNADGTTDVVFPSTATALDIKVLNDGKILIGGGNFLKRFNANGTLDNTFNVAITSGDVKKIALQTDGKIIICGSFTQVNGINRGRIARLTTDGGVDLTFDTQIGANAGIFDVAIQTNGKILIGGSFSGINFTNRPNLARLNTDGSLDTTFLPDVNNWVFTVKIQPDNKILIGGDFTIVNGAFKNRIARLNPSGTLDSTLTGSGANNRVWDIELQTDNKILVGGDFSRINNLPRLGIVRLENSLAAPKKLFDYDGDGRADVSVFRPSTNRWYQILSGNGSVAEQTFGVSGDIISPADYDGDGKTDIGIFRPSNGNWWYLSSVDGGQKNFQWGANGDIPRPSDFDGDGKADFIIFRTSENNWYRFGSSTGVSVVNFGLAGDKPVSGDFDGDGKSDVAIYRPSTGDWWYQSSINGAQLATRWGISTDIPTPADFDGDGKTDFAVYRPSTGVWYVINSSNGSFTIMAFGISEDKPIPADYDGDGKADIAVFRPSTGIWYLMRSTAGFTALQFGVSTDIPTQNAFVP